MWKRTWKSKWARFISREKNNLGINWQKTNWISIELWPICQKGDAQETDAKTREFLHRYNFNSTNQLFQCLHGSLISYNQNSKIWSNAMTQGGGYSAGPHHHSERPKHKSDRLPKCKSSDDPLSFWLCELFRLYLDLRSGVWRIFGPIWKRSSLPRRKSLIIWGMLP